MLTPEQDDLMYGAEFTALDLARALAELGLDVELILWHSTPLSINSPRVRVHRLTASSPFSVLKAGMAVAKTISRTHSDAVYAYSEYYENTLVSAFLGSVLTRKRLLVAVLDDEKKEIDRLSLPRVLARRLASGHALKSSLRFMAFQGLRRFVSRTNAVCIVSTRSVANYAKTFLKARGVFVVGRGVNELWFGRMPLQPKFDAVYVGGLWRHKRLDVLLSAWTEVIRARPDAKLLVIGGGTELARLRNRAEELGLSARIIFTGYIGDPHEVHKLLSASRVFVFPSEKEGFARVVAEAMAAGLPCVLSDIQVFREIYSEAAILVPVGDVKGFADAILDLLNDRAKRDDIVQRSVHLARSFTWVAVARKVLLILQG